MVQVVDSNSKVAKQSNEFGHFISTLKQVTAVNKARDYHNNKGGKFLKKLWCCVGGSITK